MVVTFKEEFSKIYEQLDPFARDSNFIGAAFAFISEKSNFFQMNESLEIVSDLCKKYKRAAVPHPASPPKVKGDEKTAVQPKDCQEEPEDSLKEPEVPPPKGNGGETEKYVWTQTLQELQVAIKLPDGVSGKDIKVDFSKDRLAVRIKSEHPILYGALCKAVEPANCMWTIDYNAIAKQRVMTLYLAKKNKMEWWDCVVEGDPKIDPKTIRPEDSSIDDLDGDMQQTVRKMMVQRATLAKF